MGAVGSFGWIGEQVVDLPGDMPFQAADDLPAVFAFCLSFLGVGDGGLVVAHTGDGDPPQGIVGLAVAAPIKLESTDLSCVGGVMRAFVVFGAVEDRFVGVRGGLPGPVGTSDRFRSV